MKKRIVASIVIVTILISQFSIVLGKGLLKEDNSEFAEQLSVGEARAEREAVQQVEIDSAVEGYEVIQLPEKVDPVLFIEGFQKIAEGIVE